MLVNASRQGLVQDQGLCKNRGLGAAVSKVSGCRQQRAGPPQRQHLLRQASQELSVENLPDHPLPEVWHVLLCEVDRSVFGNAVSILARKHPTITSIHLLWNFLAFLAEELPAIGVKLFPFLVNAFLL